MKTIMFSANMIDDVWTVSERALDVHHAAFVIIAGNCHTEWRLKELLHSLEVLEDAAKYMRRSIANRQADLDEEDVA